jgi:hypothetical protein
MPDTPTFGRYAEIPVEQMTAEQQTGYRFLVDGPRGRLPGAATSVGQAHACSIISTYDRQDTPCTASAAVLAQLEERSYEA